MTNIEITFGDTTQTFEPGQVVSIGRSEDSSVRIDDKMVSRYHAQINFDEQLGAWVYKDLGSANSSLIDGEEVKTKQLLGPQVIKLGFQDEAPVIHSLVRIDSTDLDDATIVVSRADFSETTETQGYSAPSFQPAPPAPAAPPAPSVINVPQPVTVPLTPAPAPPTPAPAVQTPPVATFCPRCGTAKVGNFCGGCGYSYL